MENASKALIIAGAILLSILIIAIGMYIFNSSQTAILSAGDEINAQEKQIFNQQWEIYEGVQVGANIRSLISKLSANAKANEDEDSRLPDLYIEPISNATKCTIVSKVGNINIAGFNNARTAVQARHNYTVKLTMDPVTAMVNLICVTY